MDSLVRPSFIPFVAIAKIEPEYFGHNLCEFVRHRRTRWDIDIDLEAFKEAFYSFEEFA